MLNGKILAVLIALLVVVAVVCQMYRKKPTKEGFWMIGGRKWKTIPTVRTAQGAEMAVGSGNFIGNLGDDRFIKTPSFQALMSPRFNNTGMTPHIRYNPAPMKYQAAKPCDPLLTGAMAEENYAPPADVQENYPTSCGGSGCGTGGCAAGCGVGGRSVPAAHAPAAPADFAAGDYNQEVAQARASSPGPEVVNALPMGTMSSIDAEGNQVNPVVYNNFVFANQKSRLRSYGDPIRGDLPIVPCTGSWFSVHPNVGLDLHEGAMNVLSGNANQTGQALAQLQTVANGVVTPLAGDPTPFAGLGNMIPEYATGLSAGGTDVQVSGMP